MGLKKICSRTSIIVVQALSAFFYSCGPRMDRSGDGDASFHLSSIPMQPVGLSVDYQNDIGCRTRIGDFIMEQ